MTPRDRRALRLGFAAVGLALAARLGVIAAARVWDARERLDARVELLARMRADLREAPRLQDSAEAVRRKIGGLAGEVLAPGTEMEAAASLSSLVSMAADRGHLRVSRSETMPDSARAGPARRVSVRASLESDTGGLVGFLSALASGAAVLTVGELSVAADPPPSPSAPELLHTDVTVRGWYLPRAEPR